MKLGLISLGCPKNLVDSEVMLGIIEKYHIENGRLLPLSDCNRLPGAALCAGTLSGYAGS